jgi:RNA polymerase sigma-70 factor (ECF subfamily)
MFTKDIARLIEQCRQGDADALGELYKAYAQRMRSVCRKYISDEQDVDDVLHDAFVIIYTSFDKLRDASKAEGWMMSITRNVALKYKDHLDNQPFVPLKEAESLAAPDEENSVRGIPLEDVLRMVDRLPEGYGQIFRLSAFEGMSHKEIAAMLGIEAHSSSSQLARAKKMLRKMMQQYWAVLLLLLIPVTFFLLKRDTTVKEESPIVAKQKKDDGEHLSSQKELSMNADTLQSVITHIVTDSLTDMMAQEKEIPDTIQRNEQSDTTQAVPTNPQAPRHTLVDFIHDTPIKRQMKTNWQLALAYAGTPSSDMTRTDNYMTIPSYSGAATRSTKLYNWGDYMNYVNENAPMMDSVSASNMNRMAIINSNHPSEPLIETKNHERPLILELSLSRQLNSRWSISTGLSYTRMKSTFQSGNESTLIYRTQKLHYLGIPLRLNYRLTGGKRWSLYTSGGLQLDLPVSARLSTQYIYSSPYADIETSPAVQATINAPWQWSFGIGTGIQYEIVPHLKVYLEPSLNYYIPSSDAVETYRTEHPLDLSLPLGIRISW